MPSVEDLGRRVKLKFPGSYDDLSDFDLGQKVKQRFPGSYDDFTGSEVRLSDPQSPLSDDPRIRRMQIQQRAALERAGALETEAEAQKQLLAETGAAVAGSLIPGGPAIQLGRGALRVAGALGARTALGAAGGAVGAGVQAGFSGGDVLPAAGRGALVGGALGLGVPALGLNVQAARLVAGGDEAAIKLAGKALPRLAAQQAARQADATQVRGAVAEVDRVAETQRLRIGAQQEFPLEEFTPGDPQGRLFRAENLSQAAQARVEDSPAVKNLHRGLFSEIAKHPTLQEREARLAWATGALGRSVKTFNDLTAQDRRKLMVNLQRLRKRAEAVPEAKRLQDLTDNIDNRLMNAPDAKIAEVHEGLMGGWHKAVTSVSSRFKLMGPAGVRFADLMERSDTEATRRAAGDILDLKKILKRFKKKDRILIQEVMQGAPTPRQEIKQAAAAVSAILSRYADEAEEMGLPIYNAATGRTSAFERRARYYPHIFSKESIKRLPKKERAAIRAQMDRVPPRYRGGGVQFARNVDLPGWETDPLKAVTVYINRTSHRLAVARHFGTKDDIAKQLLREIDQTAGVRVGDQAQAMWTAFAAPMRREFSGLLQPLRDAASVGMLTTTGLLQPGQMANTVARAGFLNTVRGVAAVTFNPAAKEWAERTGAAANSIMNDISPDGKSIAGGWSKVIGLEISDRANRLASAVATKLRVQQIADAAVNGRLTKAHRFDAERLGVSIDDIIKKGGVSDETLSLAAQRGSNETQFATRFQDLPEWRENEIGRTILLFRSFALQQGRFVKGLVKDAQRGHWAPLLRFVAGAGTIAQPMGEIIRSARGDEPPEHPVWRALENISYTISLGFFQDAVRAAVQGQTAKDKTLGIFQFLGGPVIGEGVGIAADAVQSIAEGDVAPIQRRLIRRTVRRVPFVGRELAEQVAP